MKVMINRGIIRHPWGGGSHFLTALSDYLESKGVEVVFSLVPDIDVIVMIDPRPDKGGDDVNYLYNYKLQNPKCKILHRVNDTDIARNTNFLDNIMIQSNKVADHTVFISRWVKDYYRKKGMILDDNSYDIIINGCDPKWYYPKEKNVPGEKVRLITHHWSDNFMKGFDVYNYLDDLCGSADIEFTYMGRYNKQYTPKNTTVIPPKYGSEVGDILRSHDVYVTAARWEACGMHHIEGSSCGLPVLYFKDGGAISEVCRSHGVEFEDPKTFISGLNEIVKNYDQYRDKIDYEYLRLDRCLEKYHKILASMVEESV